MDGNSLDIQAVRDIRPASHLTHEECHYLEEHNYIVGPKADGERMLLVCVYWGPGRRMYLISPTQLGSMVSNKKKNIFLRTLFIYNRLDFVVIQQQKKRETFSHYLFLYC